MKTDQKLNKQTTSKHLGIVQAEAGDVRVQGDGDQVEGGGGAGDPQRRVVAPVQEEGAAAAAAERAVLGEWAGKERRKGKRMRIHLNKDKINKQYRLAYWCLLEPIWCIRCI